MSKKHKCSIPAILNCPVCGKEPERFKEDEWDDWGRWIDRTLYKIKCCTFETTLEGEKHLAINQWNNKVTRYLHTKKS